MPRILVVDDDRDLLQITAEMLQANGLEVETASSSEEAFEKISNFRPQVILLDVFLSGVDGLETCRQIKQQPENGDIAVMIFSGFRRSVESRMHDYGADDFIAKPFEMNELISKVHKLLSRVES
jgi:DNA-binding response OmpR family regulator